MTIENKNIASVLSRLIVGLVAVFPLGLAVVCTVPNFFGGWGLFWNGHPYSYYFLPDVVRHLPLGLPLALMWIGFFVWFCRRQLRGEMTHLPLKIFGLTLLSRGFFALTVGQFVSPFSDFGFAWDRACTGVVNPLWTSHLLCPTWMNFSMFERLWVVAFGSNVGGGLLLSAIFNSLTAVAIYYFALLAFARKEIAVLAALLYVFYPSSMIYTLTNSCEHMGIACFMMMSVLLAVCATRDLSKKRLFALMAVAGVLAGFGNSVKPIFPIYLIATMIALVLRMLQRGSSGWRGIFASLAAFVVFVLTAELTDHAVLRCTERMFNTSLRMTPVAHCLCVGLNRQGEGQIHVGNLSRTWHKCYAEGLSPEAATRETYERVKADWQGHANEVLPFFMKKFVWTWQDDNRPFGCAMLQLGKKLGDKVLDNDDKLIMAQVVQQRELGVTNEEAPTPKNDAPTSRAEIMDYVWQSVQTSGVFIYAVVMLLACWGVTRYQKEHAANVVCVWNALIVLGFWGLMVLSESSSRYKCLIMPNVFVLAAPLVASILSKREVNNSKEGMP